ncbi:type II secretion system F family protein [Aquibacillus halophilus]|uniref:Type II secretion system F family protein n=1 Tax=Aquibacillus halophilus TaxID=930132 RepID=A0A6A8DIN4_9BACI|nr:type II secretion system F family protein [Aquibacillus halophilus]MRH44316.1 type II secretion system F family protein [Aquibacillus halophilus]
MILFLYGFTLLLFFLGMITWRTEKKKKVSSRISTVFKATGQSDNLNVEETQKLSFTKRIIEPIWKNFKRKFQKNITNEKKEKLELKLLQAGSPMGMTPVEFRIFQMIVSFVLPIIAGLYGLLLNLSNGVIFLFIVVGFGLSTFIPNYYLKLKTKKRNKRALMELPDFLDLVTVSIEAGLGFDSALSKVVSKKPGVLASEFQRCLEEMRLGKTRKEALSGVRSRLMFDDIRSLVGSIIQAEQLGIGMVQIMRVQSNEIREKRKQRAEEAAMKAPIKMLFPLVMFIFPCIFIVLLGPALINLLQGF